MFINEIEEAKEMVLNYVSVMARPVAFNRYHPIVWSHLYADIVVRTL